MAAYKIRHAYWLILILCLLSALPIGKGCKRDRNNNSPVGPTAQAPVLSLKITEDSKLQAKSVGLTIDAVGLDQNGAPTNDVADSISISNPSFPLDVDLTVFTPPCRWLMTITVKLSRDPARQKRVEFDACDVDSVSLNVDTFEAMQIDTEGPIYAPASAIAGVAAEVRCGPVDISAPDSTPVAQLSELSGQSVSGPIGSDASVSLSFPDPYPVALPSSEIRTFTCIINDGISPPQSFQQNVLRILPTPTPTSTPTPTATPTVTPAPTLTPTSTPTPTPKPAPPSNDLYVATNNIDADDANACTDPAEPCKTVNGALAKAGDGMTIHIDAGTYPENVAIAVNNLTLIGEGGTVELTPASGNGVEVTAIGVTLQDLEITATGDGIYVHSSGAADLTNVTVTGYTNGLYIDDGSSATVYGGSYTGATNQGIRVYSSGAASLTSVTAIGDTNGLGVAYSGASATVSGGSYAGTTNHGISVYSSGTANFTNVTAIGSLYGLSVSGSGSSATVSGGSLTGSTIDGIIVWTGGEIEDISDATIDGANYAIRCPTAESVTSLSGGNTCTGGIAKTSGCTFFPNLTGVCP